MSPETPRPLILTTNPRLDAAVQEGWDTWSAAARSAGGAATVTWLRQRLRATAGDELNGLVTAVLTEPSTEIGLYALIDLAEQAEGELVLADTLWEGVLAGGEANGDPDVIAEATAQLAAIAEAHGDLLAAAEYHLFFLNWRRQAGHASDPEMVETAFDEVIRLAGADGAPREAAVFAFRQAEFTRLLDAEDERAFAGDWEAEPAPYQGWT